MWILDIVVSVFQKYHPRELIWQNQRLRILLDEAQVSFHIIRRIIDVRKTTDKSQHWLPKPRTIRDTTLPLIGGVASHITEQPGISIYVAMSCTMFMIFASTKRNPYYLSEVGE